MVPGLHILMKPASGLCNMRCKYCFYVDEMQNRSQESFGMMSEETLENVIKKAMEYAGEEVTFAYQGGEPTLRGLDFFKKAIELQKKYNTKSLKVYNALQTNGYAIDDDWCKFFAENKFLLGLSIDGKRKTHDENRKDANGNGTFLRCLETADLFDKFHVEYNILTVVNRQTATKIRRIYQEYEKRGFHYQQYIACLDPLFEETGKQPYSLTPQLYGDFLVELFQMWYDDWKAGKEPYIRTFENYIRILLSVPPEACEQNGVCGCQNVIEADGSVYPCDFFMLDAYRLGNLNTDSFEEIADVRKKIQFVEHSVNHSESCKACEYFGICRGGCNRHRINGDNYFCAAYKRLFDVHLEKMKEIASALAQSSYR